MGDVTVRVTAGDGVCDDTAAAEHTVSFGCPSAGDTHVTDLALAGPPGNAPGSYTATATASDDSLDAISYTFSASNGVDPPTTVGPQAGNSANFTLGAGQWTVSVSVDDDPNCADVAADASRSVEVTVLPLSCDLAIECTLNPDGASVHVRGGVIGPSPDCNCDQIVVRRDGVEIFRGPTPESGEADFPFDPACDDQDVTFEVACVGPRGEGSVARCTQHCPRKGTPFIRGDCNQDGEVCRSVSDMVREIEICFLGQAPQPTCPAACDANGDGQICGDVSDILYIANYCFTGEAGPPPAPFPDCDVAEGAICDPPTFCAQ